MRYRKCGPKQTYVLFYSQFNDVPVAAFNIPTFAIKVAKKSGPSTRVSVLISTACMSTGSYLDLSPDMVVVLEFVVLLLAAREVGVLAAVLPVSSPTVLVLLNLVVVDLLGPPHNLGLCELLMKLLLHLKRVVREVVG